VAAHGNPYDFSFAVAEWLLGWGNSL